MRNFRKQRAGTAVFVVGQDAAARVNKDGRNPVFVEDHREQVSRQLFAMRRDRVPRFQRREAAGAGALNKFGSFASALFDKRLHRRERSRAQLAGNDQVAFKMFFNGQHGRDDLTPAARLKFLMRASVTPLMAETITTRGVSACAPTMPATRSKAGQSSTDVPPNFRTRRGVSNFSPSRSEERVNCPVASESVMPGPVSWQTRAESPVQFARASES